MLTIGHVNEFTPFTKTGKSSAFSDAYDVNVSIYSS